MHTPSGGYTSPCGAIRCGMRWSRYWNVIAKQKTTKTSSETSLHQATLGMWAPTPSISPIGSGSPGVSATSSILDGGVTTARLEAAAVQDSAGAVEIPSFDSDFCSIAGGAAETDDCAGRGPVAAASTFEYR